MILVMRTEQSAVATTDSGRIDSQSTDPTAV